jgi:ABC-type transport system involved in multi-copper enzyme maturation permease subunit
MKLRDVPGALDRTQHARWFKVAATIALAILVAGAYTWYAVGVQSGTFAGSATVLERLEETSGLAPDDPRLRLIGGVLQDSSVTVSAGVGAAVALAIGVIVVWLGLGLTYLFIALLATLVAGPMLLFGPTEVYGRLILGVLVLSAAFTALMQALRVLLGGPGAVMGVARNMLTEAVRMKISLVLIILMILGLAVLPGFLDADQPLRYRVQSFFQYSVTGTFWVLAFLTLAFGIASITGEQRDKVIWQTVTKPVAAWQYLLGKWLGIVGLNAVLLVVASSGIFLFAEYLRNQPAIGETQAYLSPDAAVSEDRFILESRVLTARKSVDMEIPEDLSRGSEVFEERVREYIAAERLTDSEFARTPDDLEYVVDQLEQSTQRLFRAIPPGDSRIYRMLGLADAKTQDSPLTLRVRIDAEGNRPDAFYEMTFALPFSPDPTPLVKTMGLGYYHNIALTTDAINDEGVLEVVVFNGRLVETGSRGLAVVPNASTAVIPEGGLEVSYRAGGYRANFVRVMFVLWIKLAFLAMLAVCASTFLSFPVACLIAFGLFLLAEMSGFLVMAAETYSTTDQRGNEIWFKTIIANITNWVGLSFGIYNDLKPVRRLVDGRLLPWSSAGVGVGVLLCLTGGLYAVAIAIFRRRELAIYSGN